LCALLEDRDMDMDNETGVSDHRGVDIGRRFFTEPPVLE